jgi:hypothetical protein
VCYFRSTEGTNCGVAGIVAVEYLDASEKVLYTFSPQLPGGTFSAGGYFGGKTSVTERAGNRGISYTIDTATDKLLSCEHFEVNSREYVCTRIDLYADDGQFAATVEVSKEGNSLYVDHTVDQWGNHLDFIDEHITDYETVTNDSERTLCYFNLNLVAEIIREPVIEVSTGMLAHGSRKLEIKNSSGEIIGTYETSGPDSLLFARVIDPNFVFVDEIRMDFNYILSEKLDSSTGYKFSQEANAYSENGTLIREETTHWTKEGVTSYHHIINHDAAGNKISEEIEFWGAKVVTTFDTTYNGIYSKAEFYNAEGVLQKTVEPVDGSVGFLLDFSKEDHCLVEFYDKNGETVSYDAYWPES